MAFVCFVLKFKLHKAEFVVIFYQIFSEVLEMIDFDF